MNRGKQGGPTKDSRWWEARRDREVKQFRMESWKRIGQFGKRPKNSSRKTESRKLARKLGSLSVFRGRPPGYEKYEIWFSRVVNGYTALYVYMCVCVCVYIYIYLSRSPARFPTRVYILLCIVAPHAYRGRISGVLCPCVQQDIVHWETGKQVLEELTCTLFNRTLLLFMEKPLSSFFRQNKSCGYS